MKKIKKILPFAMFGIIVLVAIFAPVLAPHDPTEINIKMKLAAFSSSYPLGNDQLGRCILSRLIFGTRISISLSLFLTLLILLISIPIGLIVGWYDDKFGKFFDWFSIVALSFPGFLFAMTLVGILGPGIINIVVSVIIFGWVRYAIILKNSVLSQKNQNYVIAARTEGCSVFYIMRKHIFPFVIRPMLCVVIMNAGALILMISSFSFLGIGVQPKIAEWGMMINDARPYFSRNPMLMFYPGFMIFITVTIYHLMANALKEGD